jgi:PAS domain S-box-containing protein
MPLWQILTALVLVSLFAFAAHVFYRRPPAALWPSLPLVFGFAAFFTLGDLITQVAVGTGFGYELGRVIRYAGLLGLVPAWWAFTRRYHDSYALDPSMPESRVQAARWVGPRHLALLNALFFVGLLANPWHGQFLDATPGTRSGYGPIWYWMAGVNYIVLLGNLLTMVRLSLKATDATIRNQSRFMALAMSIPLATNFIFVSLPFVLLQDPTAMSFAISCGLFLLAVGRLDLFALDHVSLPDVLENDDDAILVVTPEWRLIYANHWARRLLGQDNLLRGGLIDRLIERQMAGFPLELNQREGRHSAAPGQEELYRLTNTAGEEFWVAVDVTPFTWQRGNSAGFCIRLRDQTELRSVRSAMEDHATVLEAINRLTGEGLVVQDLAGRIRYVNEAFLNLWGISGSRGSSEELDALEGQILDWLGENAKEFESAWHGSLSDFDSAFSLRADTHLDDGRILEISSFPITDKKGIEGRGWKTWDVTSQRADTQAMIHAQKLEGLGLLAGGIAHDFNNLLVAILGNAELARDSMDEDLEAVEFLRDVESSAERAAELTSQLLAYTGKAEFELEEIDISELIKDVADLLAVSIPKSVEVTYQVDDDLPHVMGGAGQLRQIAMNLVINASDAIGKSEGNIKIETGSGIPPGVDFSRTSATYGDCRESAIYLRVIDDGSGMSEETLGKIFDPFFTTKLTGRGLGLAATVGIIESHRGKLRVDSAEGVGTAFTVLLPALDTSTDLKKAEEKAVPNFFPGRRALAVDDEPAVLTLLVRMLRKAQFEVFTATTGRDALKCLSDADPPIELIVLDLNMPNVDGAAVWSRLRHSGDRIPIIVSSGYPREDLQLDGPWSESADGFIRKPYRSQDLLNEVGRLLSQDREDSR